MRTWIFNHLPKSTRSVSSMTAFTGVSQAPLIYGMTFWWNHYMIQFMAKAISIYQFSFWAFIWVRAHRKLLHLRPWRKTTLIFLKEIQVIASLSTFGLHSHWKLWIHFNISSTQTMCIDFRSCQKTEATAILRIQGTNLKMEVRNPFHNHSGVDRLAWMRDLEDIGFGTFKGPKGRHWIPQL